MSISKFLPGRRGTTVIAASLGMVAANAGTAYAAQCTAGGVPFPGTVCQASCGTLQWALGTCPAGQICCGIS